MILQGGRELWAGGLQVGTCSWTRRTKLHTLLLKQAAAAAAAAAFHQPDSSEGPTAEEPPHFIHALTTSARTTAWALVKIGGATRPQLEDCPSGLCKCPGEIGSSGPRTWRRPARLDFAGSAATGADAGGRAERQRWDNWTKHCTEDTLRGRADRREWRSLNQSTIMYKDGKDNAGKQLHSRKC